MCIHHNNRQAQPPNSETLADDYMTTHLQIKRETSVPDMTMTMMRRMSKVK